MSNYDDTTTRAQMERAIKSTGEDPASVVCFYRAIPEGGDDAYDIPDDAPVVRCAVADLPMRLFDPGFGGVDGEPVIGFGPRYVYIKGCYDGSEWIQGIPRHPEGIVDKNSLPVVGGG